MNDLAMRRTQIAFDDDILYALLGRWVSEIEPHVFRNEQGFIIGLGVRREIGETAEISLRREQLSIEEIIRARRVTIIRRSKEILGAPQ